MTFILNLHRLPRLLAYWLGLGMTLGFAQAAAAAERATDAEIVKDLRAYVERQAANDVFSGAVLFAKGDQILFAQAYGYANHAFNAPNKLDTKFNMGSMSKMFTAVATLQLIQQGKFSLDDKVIKLLPDYPDKDIAAKITVYQLLTHTSGLGDIFNKKFVETPRGKFRDTQSYLSLFAGEPLLFEPGARFSYSSAGFVVLGMIIEKVSGQNYYDYVREHLFKPAGMLNTDFYSTDEDVPNLALGYTHFGLDERMHPDQPRRTNVLINFARGGPPGGAYSTVEDFLKFSLALQGHKLLNKEYTDLAMTGNINVGRGKYGFGMSEEVMNGVRIVGHNGGFPGVNGQLDMYPELGYTVIALSNYDDAAEPINRWLRRALINQR